MIKRIGLLLMMSGVFIFAEDFIIGAYGLKRDYFSNAHDSLRLNTVLNEWIHTEAEAMDILSTAEDESLKVLLTNAPPPQGTSPGRLLSWYCNLWYKMWESDEDGTYFEHDEGKAVFDDDALNDSAWACSVGVDVAGWMQRCTWNSQFKIYTDNWWGPVEYTASFRLKIDTTSLDSTTKVCSLTVYDPDVDSIFKDSVMTIADFQEQNIYQSVDLKFIKEHGSNNRIWYTIWWYDNVSLWADNVEVKDCFIDSLLIPLQAYDQKLAAIAQLYSPFYCEYKSLYRFYLRDEPRYGHFAANRYIMDFLALGDNYQYGIQALGAGGKELFETYADSVQSQELMFDYYPMRGAGYSGGRTPEDSGAIFQKRLDTLCYQLSDMRAVALDDTIDFWFIVQAFGKYDAASAYDADSGGNEGDWRLPTPRELRCMTWLSLAHGAQGIMYFRYNTKSTTEAGFPEWMRGLWRSDNTPREPLYSEAKSINQNLEIIGSRLLTLESDTVFKVSEGIPPDCYIKDVSEDLIQIGTFQHEGNEDDRYFIIVNRHCLPSDEKYVTVGIENTNPDQLYYLYDCLTKELITSGTEKGPPPFTQDFTIYLPPGQGRLLRVVPLGSEFQINQGEEYINLPYVALNTKANSVLSIDSMRIWEIYYGPPPDTIQYLLSTIWLPYDTTHCWQTVTDRDTNIIRIQYKVGGFSESPEYCDSIVFDDIAPIGSFVINDDDKFTNTSEVVLNNSLSDERSGMATMYYDNECLINVLKNSAFDNTSYWVTDTAIYHSEEKLFEIPIESDGNEFYQIIAPESLAMFDNDTMVVSVDITTDAYEGTGWLAFVYVYGIEGDTMAPLSEPDYHYGDSTSIPLGTQARVSQYNLKSYFQFHPDPPPGEELLEARVGIFVENGATNAGRLFIDNLRLDIVSPYDIDEYDTLCYWTLAPGNGVRHVYGQFTDASGNESEVLYDSIIVDTTKPTQRITSPQHGQTINRTVTIMGWAYDYTDPEQHFKEYELAYKKLYSPDTTWYGVHPESLFYAAMYPFSILAQWNTQQVTDNHGNGWYDLRLMVRDSAENYADTMISIRIRNRILLPDTLLQFSHDVYGLAAQEDIYVGEIETGMIHQYSSDYQLLNSFELSDSCDIGFPLAMNIDKNNKLWVTNIISQLINRFTNQGNPDLHFGGGFSLPSGIVSDAVGHVWVTDRLHNKVKKFDGEGNLLFQFGQVGNKPGKIKWPMGIALHGETLYIADSWNKRISVFDTAGNFIEIIGDTLGLSQPFGLVIDSTGCLFVSDFDSNRVLALDPYGNVLFEIDSLLDGPTALALSGDANILYVSDTKHKQVLAFTVREEPSDSGGGPQSEYDAPLDMPLFAVYPSLFSKQVNIMLNGFIGKNVSLVVYDVLGRRVKTFYDNQPIVMNEHIIWDARDNLKRKIPCGVYFVRLVVNPETSEYKETRKTVLLK
jgi:sugar lactone lactonase YvrE